MKRTIIRMMLLTGMAFSSYTVLAQVPDMPGLNLQDLDLLNQVPKEWVAPNRLFSIHVPNGWQVHTYPNDPYVYDVKPNFAPGVFLQIKRILVPAGAAPQHVMRNDIDNYLSKFPMYETLLEQKSARLSGYKASSLQFKYAFQNNIQYQRFVQRIYLVVGEEAFVLHFEAPVGRAQSMQKAITKIQNNFIVRPPGSVEDPFAAPGDPDAVDDLPF